MQGRQDETAASAGQPIITEQPGHSRTKVSVYSQSPCLLHQVLYHASAQSSDILNLLTALTLQATNSFVAWDFSFHFSSFCFFFPFINFVFVVVIFPWKRLFSWDVALGVFINNCLSNTCLITSTLFFVFFLSFSFPAFQLSLGWGQFGWWTGYPATGRSSRGAHFDSAWIGSQRDDQP